jgi:hypothetical protein
MPRKNKLGVKEDTLGIKLREARLKFQEKTGLEPGHIKEFSHIPNILDKLENPEHRWIEDDYIYAARLQAFYGEDIGLENYDLKKVGFDIGPRYPFSGWWVYYARVNCAANGKIYYKIGMTSRKFKDRFPSNKKLKYTQLMFRWYPSHRDASEVEQNVLDTFTKYRVIGLGNLEIFCCDVLGLDKEILGE